jgi:MFS family permease
LLAVCSIELVYIAEEAFGEASASLQALNNAAYNLGGIVGPLLVGFITSYYELQWGLVAVAAMTTVFMMCYIAARFCLNIGYSSNESWQANYERTISLLGVPSSSPVLAPIPSSSPMLIPIGPGSPKTSRPATPNLHPIRTGMMAAGSFGRSRAENFDIAKLKEWAL